jgi:hypothetical protein
MRTVEEAAAEAGAGAALAHGWTLHAIDPVTPAEATAVLAEPAAAVPQGAAERLGTLRLFAAPFLACGGEAEFVAAEKPRGESHSSLWLERGAAGAPPAARPSGNGARRRGPAIDLFIAIRDADAHDAGFELLAVLADLLTPRLSDDEFLSYARLLQREIGEGATGEIDEEALEARDSADPDYVTVSLASTLAEYMHALWHDVEARPGAGHLAPQFLRRRFELLAGIFPPDPGQTLFR